MKRNARVAAAAVVLSALGLVLWRSKSAAPTVIPTDFGGKTTLQDNGANGSKPRVDIVFALDTTGSMGGLIAGAKTKIWEIARRAQQGKPAPELRVGLVGYRDVGDSYVTKTIDLTSDLDEVYAKLSEFQAGGGGDGPEHVLKGLHDAIDGSSWSKDSNAVKLVYLVGDAPPHLDYQDGLTMDGVLSEARQKGVHISAIRCGQDNDTLRTWSLIAQRTDGEVSTIEQSGGVVAVTTPFDDDLARLNAKLAGTEIHWGSEGERKEAQKALATNMAAPSAAQAERAGFYAANAAAGGPATKKDLVAAKPSDVAAVPTAALPEPLQAMSTEERTRFVEEKRKERDGVLKEIREASDKREAFLKTAAPKPAATSFDAKVYDSLRKAGAKSGIAY